VRIIALVESLEHVCARYRTLAFAKPLLNSDIIIELVPLPKGILSRQKLLWSLKGEHVIVLRKLLNWIDWRILRKRAKWIAFELDDAVYLRDSYSEKGFNDNRRMARFERIVSESDIVIAGNNHLATEVLAHGGKGRVTVIPTCVDTNKYRQKEDYSTVNLLTLVWIGSSSTLQGLHRFKSSLENLGKMVSDVQLKLICDKFINFDHLKTIHCPWSESTETSELANSDVGISWIPDDPWSKGKCGLKLIQSMAAGLPVIANPIGVHPEMIAQGINGYLVNSSDEWINAINKLKNQKDLREMMGRNGRYLVEKSYSIEFGLKKWLEILK